METTTTPFDLNHAIQQWRDNLAQSPAFKRENLEELEVHLRDSVARLQTRELSAEEAFLIATKRVGGAARLGAEFGKVNSQLAWLDRMFWALVMMQAWFVVQSLVNTFTMLVGNNLFGAGTGGAFLMGAWGPGAGISMVTSVIPLVFAALLIWRLFKNPQSRFRSFLEAFSRRPFTLAFMLLGARIVVTFLYILSSFPHSRRFPVEFIFRSLSPELLYAGVIFILARKRLLRIA